MHSPLYLLALARMASAYIGELCGGGPPRAATALAKRLLHGASPAAVRVHLAIAPATRIPSDAASTLYVIMKTIIIGSVWILQSIIGRRREGICSRTFVRDGVIMRRVEMEREMNCAYWE
jgi:hypothetical protein